MEDIQSRPFESDHQSHRGPYVFFFVRAADSLISIVFTGENGSLSIHHTVRDWRTSEVSTSRRASSCFTRVFAANLTCIFVGPQRVSTRREWSAEGTRMLHAASSYSIDNDAVTAAGVALSLTSADGGI